MESYWDVVVSSLQDTCNSNELISFDELPEEIEDDNDDSLSSSSQQRQKEHLLNRKETVLKHKENLEKTKRILETALVNVNGLLSQSKSSTPFSEDHSNTQSSSSKASQSQNTTSGKSLSSNYVPVSATTGQSSANSANSSSFQGSMSTASSMDNAGGLPTNKRTKSKINQKQGRSYYQSNYNPSDPIVIGSEVAFKPKQKYAEWIQCKVLKVFNELKFEIKDPEPDDNNPNGQHFKCNWKEIILIPSLDQMNQCKNYPFGCKVLARYPETTTFYPAEVIGFKKDGTCRLKFEGEEEEDKETEVERRLVLPFPH